MTEREANDYFCTESAYAKRVFKNEQDWADTSVPFSKNHAYRCKKYLEKTRTQEIEIRGGLLTDFEDFEESDE